MRNYKRHALLFFVLQLSLQEVHAKLQPTKAIDEKETAVGKREVKEEKVRQNDFAITFYKQNYLFPLYYTSSPYAQVYQGNTPEDETVKKTEISYQLSFKIPLWKDIASSHSSLYVAYTQLSFWQAYNKVAFFRSNDFEPEIFCTNEVAWKLMGDWSINAINVGAVHASNGFGSSQERVWNRLYVETVVSNPRWMFTLRPWYVLRDGSYRKFNPDMADHMGYGIATAAYKLSRQVFTLQGHGFIEKRGRYKTGILSYSFPMTSQLNGFIQVFSGYGQSLIEYNHYTNGVGVGLLLNDLI